MPSGVYTRGLSLRQRFDRGVDDSGGPNACWPFKRNKPNGDGYIWLLRTKGGVRLYVGVHQIAYVKANGPIPKGLHVLHHCDNPPCCNPKHLFLGTQADNNKDKMSKGRQRNLSGEQHPKVKLTDKQVARIRSIHSRAKQQNLPRSETAGLKRRLARRNGISINTVNAIVGRSRKYRVAKK